VKAGFSASNAGGGFIISAKIWVKNSTTLVFNAMNALPFPVLLAGHLLKTNKLKVG